MGSVQPNRVSLPWIQTPCLRSAGLSRVAGCEIYLKFENLQPSGSFKSRGIGNLMLRAIESHGPEKPIHFYCSSGGNAGLACAHAATALKRPATIVVPLSTSAFMIGKLKTLGVDVHQAGKSWFEADTWLRQELLEKDKDGVYVPPFDHEDVWYGNSIIVDEIVDQIGHFDAAVCSVGGGGLFNGVMEGISRQSWLNDHFPTVVAVETIGADSLHQSIEKGEHLRLPGISSIATSLGATKVSDQTYNLARDKDRVVSVALTDEQAVRACLEFADEERVLVEPACGVSVAVVYDGILREALQTVVKLGVSDDMWAAKKVVIIVCGGSNVTIKMLEAYRDGGV